MRHLSAWTALLLLLVSPAPAGPEIRELDRDQVMVGGRMITLPAPEGYERTDGLDPALDRLMATTLPDTNRCIARFELPGAEGEVEADGIERNFNAQVFRALESEEIGERTFRDLRKQMKGEIEQMQNQVEAELAKVTGSASRALEEASGVEAALSISDVAVLGFFEETETTLGFTMAMNTMASIGGEAAETKGVVAALMLPVNGRLLYLYANAEYRSEEDRQWAEQAVSAWRDAVLAANPRVEGPAAGTSTGRTVRWVKIIGGIAIVAVVLVVNLVRKASGSA